ncbi:MAG: hypothetical protein U5O39_14595 [Gammaproteobacteria bacterium]|nr:hypothetical protein [Gammaproteobacteria bacterium]
MMEAVNYAQHQETAYFMGGLTALSFLGGCVITVVFYLPWLCSGRRLVLSGAGLIIVAAGLVLLGSLKGLEWRNDAGIDWFSVGHISLYVWAGGMVLLFAIADFWKHRDSISLLLVLWILGVFVFAWIMNWTVNGRTLLPLAPAVGIVLVRLMEAGGGMLTLRRPAWVLAAAGFAAMAGMIPVHADYVRAKSVRHAAMEIVNRRQEGQQIFFEGHWGFQWYMESLGAEMLDLSRARSGDLIVAPMNNTNVRLDVPKRMIDDFYRENFPGPTYAATMRDSLGAGFYSDFSGPLPFRFGPVPPEEYVFIRVR